MYLTLLQCTTRILFRSAPANVRPPTIPVVSAVFRSRVFRTTHQKSQFPKRWRCTKAQSESQSNRNSHAQGQKSKSKIPISLRGAGGFGGCVIVAFMWLYKNSPDEKWVSFLKESLARFGTNDTKKSTELEKQNIQLDCRKRAIEKQERQLRNRLQNWQMLEDLRENSKALPAVLASLQKTVSDDYKTLTAEYTHLEQDKARLEQENKVLKENEDEFRKKAQQLENTLQAAQQVHIKTQIMLAQQRRECVQQKEILEQQQHEYGELQQQYDLMAAQSSQTIEAVQAASSELKECKGRLSVLAMCRSIEKCSSAIQQFFSAKREFKLQNSDLHTTQCLAEALSSNLNAEVTKVNLYNNDLNENGKLTFLMNALRSNQTIRSLSLAYTGIRSDKDVDQIANALRNNSTLESLDLYWTHITDDQAEKLVRAFAESALLAEKQRELNLTETNVTEAKVESLRDRYINITIHRNKTSS